MRLLVYGSRRTPLSYERNEYWGRKEHRLNDRCETVNCAKSFRYNEILQSGWIRKDTVQLNSYLKTCRKQNLKGL